MGAVHACYGVGASRCGIQPFAMNELIRLGVPEPSTYHGNSGGALNASMDATHQRGRSMEIWMGLRNRDVFKGKFNAVRAGWAGIRNQPILDLTPLADMMNQELLGKQALPLFVQTSEYNGMFTTHELTGKMNATSLRRVYESSAIPFVFPTPGGIDGGVINPIPLDSAIRAASPGDTIVIITPHPVIPYDHGPTPTNELAKVLRAYEISQAALVRHSVGEFLRINRWLKEIGADERYDEHDGVTYKRFEAIVVAPDKALPWSMLDFDQAGRLSEAFGIGLAREAMKYVN